MRHRRRRRDPHHVRDRRRPHLREADARVGGPPRLVGAVLVRRPSTFARDAAGARLPRPGRGRHRSASPCAPIRPRPRRCCSTGIASLLVDPYTGAIIGEPPTGLRTFFRVMTTWHRYLALEGASRATGKALTGAANLMFLFIVLSGMYLWLPRVWTWIQFKNVLWFRRGLAGEGARLQLAQRHRHLVGGSARDRHRRRGADLVSVGEQSRLPNRRGHTTATRSGCRARPAERREPPVYVTAGLDAPVVRGAGKHSCLAHDDDSVRDIALGARRGDRGRRLRRPAAAAHDAHIRSRGRRGRQGARPSKA